MSTKHTPGEWYAVVPNPQGRCFKEIHFWSVSYRNGNTGGMLGAQVAEITSLNTGHEEANARLIAAAPELLEALKTCYDLGIDKTCVPMVRAAIAKATGSDK